MASIKSIQIGEDIYDFNKLQSDNAVVEVVGDKINNFANKLQFGRHVDDSNSENLLVVGNGSGVDSKSNALELTYNGELKAQTEVVVGEHRLTNKLDKEDLPNIVSKGISIKEFEKTILLDYFFVGDSKINITNLSNGDSYSFHAGPSSSLNFYSFLYRLPIKISDCKKIEVLDLDKSFFDILPYNCNYDFKKNQGGPSRYFYNRYYKVDDYTIEVDTGFSGIYAQGWAFDVSPILISLYDTDKKLSLSINESRDDVFGYNPLQDTWQSLEVVKEFNVYNEPAYKENYIYNIQSNYNQIGNRYEIEKLTIPFMGGSSQSFESAYFPVGVGYFVLQVTNINTNETKVFYIKNNKGYSLNGSSVFYHPIQMNNFSLSFNADFDSQNLNFIKNIRLSGGRSGTSDVMLEYSSSLILVENINNNVFSKNTQLVTADDFSIATEEDVKEFFSSVIFFDTINKKYCSNVIGEINTSDIYNFKYNTDKAYISKIEMSDKIDAIGEDCFAYFENLMNIVMSKNIKSIGIAAFGGCRNLKEIEIPAKTKVIKQAAFAVCTSLSKVTINGLDTEILEQAFSGCPESGTLYCHKEWYDNLSDAAKTNLGTLINWEKVWLN